MASLFQWAIGVFLALHGLVHGWYVVLSQGWVEVEDAMGWNGQSWLLSAVLPEGVVLNLASVLYVVVAAGFVAGGIGVVLDTDWWPTVLAGAAILSTVVIVVMWDGQPTQLVEKGLLGVLINVVVLVWLFVE